ncbi:MAG TPA: response regulator transcription factor [Gaiellaceae bacterium]|jgi:two-component system copper resistance phosphate regulon response regulator CusR|nr:response regulator transcription factor [Gaiellaceae bacterium]
MRILVVEDEARIQSFLARGLEAEGFGVDTAPDGATALRRLDDVPYDLVVLDLLLPRIDGLTVLRELAQRKPELPVLILSARSDLRTKLRGFELGACDYMSKPFALDELLARIRVHVGRRGIGEEPHTLQVGQLVLDPARRQARAGGSVIELSDREFKLLHQLAANAGEVLSRERLLAEVWGYHFDPGSNVVDVCIRRLRKKLGTHIPIRTVRHAGYCLDAA